MAFPLIEYLTLMFVFFIGAISPGPDFAMVLRQAIIHGRKSAIFTSLGVASGILVHGAYTILGLGIIISQSLLFFSIMKYLGAAYLLYLGLSAFFAQAPKQIKNIDEKIELKNISFIKAFSIGFLANLLNPKAMLFFISLFTIIVSANTIVQFQTFYVFSMSIMLFLWFTLVSIFLPLQKCVMAFIN